MNKTHDSLLTRFGLKDELHKSIRKGIEIYTKTTPEDTLEDQVTTILREMSVDIVNAFLGNVAGSILRSILKVQDQVSISLEKLVREPFLTGSRVAQEALHIQWEGEDERVFREERLRFAVEKLDVALTLYKDWKKPEGAMFILLLQGLCCLEIRGGLPLAKARFASVIQTLEQLAEIERLKAELRRMHGQTSLYESNDDLLALMKILKAICND